MPAPRIVVIGSINMDLVIRCAQLPRAGETIMADSSAEIPGGKGANQAVAAARAGGEVTMIGRVGDDAFGDRLIDNLRRENVNVDSILVSQSCPSGIAIVAVDSAGENSIMVVPGANGQVTARDIETASDLICAADVVLLQLEIPLETVSAAIKVAAAADVRVIVDPAPMPDRLPDEIMNVDVVCPNQAEASTLLGRRIESIDDARHAMVGLHKRGAGSAIITLGRQGAVVSDGVLIESIEPLEVTPIDSTAAGDAFAGSLAVRLAEGATLFEAARFAAAAGAIATTRLGAQPGMPSRNEIEQFITAR